jgi:outer membrane protein OmpA-like peptidoglycan-associated protein
MKSVAAHIIGVLCLTLAATAQQKDNPACKDHPLFTRMPESWIHSCVTKDFDRYEFPISKDGKIAVEGKLWRINYYPQATAVSKPSELQILRNFENAVTRQGGSIWYAGKSRETFLFKKYDKEIWVEVWAEFTGKYGFTIVEKSVMQQDIVANADSFASDLKTNGHSLVYGIYFDSGKSDLAPESDQALAEIAKLLNKDASLKLYVVGHTDNLGGFDVNLALSTARANAVVQALVSKHGIAASRLKPFGAGLCCPVASNDTDAGLARNRRVELVKQ